jgi:single-stranded-DNA-specific exonuclease
MRWITREKADKDKANALAEALGVAFPIAELLVQRGIEDFDAAKDFFRPHFDQLHPPILMKDMDKAVGRILEALSLEESMLVYGDYDVDGTTSVALMSSFLKNFSDQISTYIPDRYTEGYGVSYQGIDYAAENNINLIIALDCGIKAVEKVAYAKEKGIDFIICDHHRPGDELPDAQAILNPKQIDCSYPYKELCGCGIGFKLIQALGEELGLEEIDLIPYLDLVATAIGADIVPLDGENRTLASLGLEQLNNSPRPGFKAIIDQVGIEQLTLTNVIFIIAPRINAAGRMNHGSQAVELLVEKDASKARKISSQIEQNNTERRSVESKITKEALDQITNLKEEKAASTVVYDEHWHKGVIGIVASRLIDTYYRPTLVFTKSGDQLAASARSVKGFDIYQAIEACSDHLIQFGGHKYAAGVTLKPEQYNSFKKAFEAYVSLNLEEELKTPSISIDMELRLEDINPKFYRILKQFAPFGPENWAPTFISKGVEDSGYAKTVGEDDKHLKARFSQDMAYGTDAIGFDLGKHLNLITGRKKVDIVYSLDHNTWQGTTSIQLKLKDLKASES